MSTKELREEVDEENLFQECNIPKDVKDLDDTFRCQICASLFDKAVMIKECGHTFCSVCIRNYWSSIRSGVHRQKTACPICRTPVNVMNIEKALVMNRSIQEGVKAYKQMLIQRHLSSSDQDDDSPFQGRRRRSKRKSSATIDHVREDGMLTSCNEDGAGDELPIYKKMQSRNYSRMKKRDLQKLCRDLNISISGSEQELIHRLRNYQNMWNAEVMHSIEPKRPCDIAAKLNSEEKAQQDEKKSAQTSGVSNIEECIRNDSFKANFKEMTAQLKARMKKGKRSNGTMNAHIGEALLAGQENEKKELSHDIDESISEKVPTASSIKVIDVDSFSDVYDKSIPATASPSDTSDEPELRCSEQVSSNGSNPSLCNKRRHATKPVDQHLIVNKRSDRRKKRTSSGSSFVATRVAWMCGKCTFENKGIDYICQMCGNRR